VHALIAYRRLQVTHYASDGWLVHKSSEDARKQLEQEKTEAEAAAKFQAELDRALKEKVRTPLWCLWLLSASQVLTRSTQRALDRAPHQHTEQLGSREAMHSSTAQHLVLNKHEL
jgi:hypothetical protein